MKYNSYADYLKSEEWKEKARKRAEIDNFKCCMCGSCGTQNNPLQVHHMTYHNIYRENIYKDLTTLCKSCHKAVHRMMNRLTAPNIHGWKDTLHDYSGHVLDD